VDVEVAAVLGREKLAEVQAGIKRRLDSPDLLITKRAEWLALSKRLDVLATEKAKPLLTAGLEQLEQARQAGVFGQPTSDSSGKVNKEWTKKLTANPWGTTGAPDAAGQAAIERQRLELEADYAKKVRSVTDWVKEHPDAKQEDFNKWYNANIITAGTLEKAQAASKAAWGK
jgi:hypothetical protein